MFRPFAFLLAMTLSLFGQEMIDNPARPQGKLAGRVIELEEVLRIRESGDQFFFKFPYNLKISPNPLFGFFKMELSGESLYLIEKDENEISTVVKYRLR